MKLCQGTNCHTYTTKDRIKGHKVDKHYETRKRSSFYYHDEFCSLICQNDWFSLHGKRAIDHFGRLHEPKRTDCDGAGRKQRYWQGYNNDNASATYLYYFVNDLLGERRPITQAQYNDTNFKTPQ